MKRELAEDETLLFMDVVYPTQATKITSGRKRKDVGKTIETTGRKARLNAVRAVELNRLSSAVTAQYQTVNSDSIMILKK